MTIALAGAATTAKSEYTPDDGGEYAFVSDSITPAVGDVFIIEIATHHSAAPPAISAVSWSTPAEMTIAAVHARETYATVRATDVYVAVASGTTAGTFKCLWAAEPFYGTWRIFKYTGVDTTTPTRNAEAANGSSTTPSVTLPGAFASADNWTIGVVSYANRTYTYAAGTGFTEEAAETQSVAAGGAEHCLASQYLAGNDASVDGTISSSTVWGIIGFELVAATASPPTVVSDRTMPRGLGRGLNRGMI